MCVTSRTHAWRVEQWETRLVRSLIPAEDDHAAQREAIRRAWDALWRSRTAESTTGRPAPRGRQGSKLDGTTLASVVILPGGLGWEGDVHWPEHATGSWQDIGRERLRIARQWATEPEWVQAIRLPRGGARVVVHTRDVLADPLPWPGGGVADDGSVAVAETADGRVVRWHLWRPGVGAEHGLVVGSTGSGKSSPSAVLLAAARDDERVQTVVVDPQGMSIPGLTVDHVNVLAVGRLDGARRDLSACAAAVTEVADEARRRFAVGVTWTPTPETPLVLLVIEEAHALLDGPYAAVVRREVEFLAREARKVGVSVQLVSQMVLVDELGGSPVRSQLSRVVSMRLDDPAARAALRTGWGLDVEGLSSGDRPAPGVGVWRGETMRARAYHVAL